jgi:hypothetical protein
MANTGSGKRHYEVGRPWYNPLEKSDRNGALWRLATGKDV